jgi:hypothetical protein
MVDGLLRGFFFLLYHRVALLSSSSNRYGLDPDLVREVSTVRCLFFFVLSFF